MRKSGSAPDRLWPVSAPDLVALFVEPLERTGIPYMITGGVASVIYGDPRFTRDVDVVLLLDGAGITRLRSAFEEEDFYVPPQRIGTPTALLG